MSKINMSKTGRIILVVVLCLVLLGGIAGVVAWTQSDKFDTKDLSYIGMYEVGGLDSTGSYMSTNASIYTKKPIECQGLNCYLDFDSAISYQLYFYDQNNEFVHTTGRLTGTFGEDSVPFFAKYVRIVILPNDDDKVTSLEVSKYAKKLNVSVNREQGFKNYTENLFEVGTIGAVLNSSGAEIEVDETSSDQCVSKFINISSYKECLVFRTTYTSLDTFILHFYDAQKSHLFAKNVADTAKIIFTSSEGINYYSISLNDLGDTQPLFLAFSTSIKMPVGVYCR